MSTWTILSFQASTAEPVWLAHLAGPDRDSSMGSTPAPDHHIVLRIRPKKPSTAAASMPAPEIAAANQPMADGPNPSARNPPIAGPLSWPRPRLAVPTV